MMLSVFYRVWVHARVVQTLLGIVLYNMIRTCKNPCVHLNCGPDMLVQEMYSILRERLAEAKCKEVDVNITKIYSVFGRTQDQGTFAEARMADVSTLMSLLSSALRCLICYCFSAGQCLVSLPVSDHCFPWVKHLVYLVESTSARARLEWSHELES